MGAGAGNATIFRYLVDDSIIGFNLDGSDGHFAATDKAKVLHTVGRKSALTSCEDYVELCLPWSLRYWCLLKCLIKCFVLSQ